MRSYQIPPDISEKEKVVGGIFSIFEFIIILIGVFIGVLVFVLFYPLLDKLALIVAIPFGFSGLPVVLIKIKGLSVIEYTKRKLKFNKKQKHLLYSRTPQTYQRKDSD